MIFRRPLQVTRKLAGSYNDAGKWVDGVTSRVLTIQASVQPLLGKDVKTLPENQRCIESYCLYTNSNLTVLDERTMLRGDTVVINDKNYEVVARHDWQNGIVDHYKYIVQRVL
jgi:hypothetical protein